MSTVPKRRLRNFAEPGHRLSGDVVGTFPPRPAIEAGWVLVVTLTTAKRKGRNSNSTIERTACVVPDIGATTRQAVMS